MINFIVVNCGLRNIEKITALIISFYFVSYCILQLFCSTAHNKNKHFRLFWKYANDPAYILYMHVYDRLWNHHWYIIAVKSNLFHTQTSTFLDTNWVAEAITFSIYNKQSYNRDEHYNSIISSGQTNSSLILEK